MKNVLKYSGVMWVSRAPTGIWHCNTQSLVGGQEPSVSSMGAVGRVIIRTNHKEEICELVRSSETKISITNLYTENFLSVKSQE